MKKVYYSFLLSIVFISHFYSQNGRLPTQDEITAKQKLELLYKSSPSSAKTNHLAITGPEQDCDNAIPVCQQTYSQGNSYTGHGSSQEVNGTCLSSQETNSVWYIFTVQNSGTFTFMLNTANDYDFALYNITTIGCNGVPSATPVRCNYSATYGSTGLTLPVSGSSNIGVSASGSPTMPGLNVNAGQTFVLIIDNYSANSNGYTLTFGGTAQIYDVTPPTITATSFPCSGSSISVNFSEPVTCASIASNGSDFTITGPAGNVPVTSAVGNLCSTGASYSNYLNLNFNNAGLTTGTYTVSVTTGTDGNTILDKCGNAMGVQTFTFGYLSPITASATNTTVCAGGPSTLIVSGAGSDPGLSYSWAPSGANTSSIVVNPIQDITYAVTVSLGGCTRSSAVSVFVGQPPVVSINPANVSLCSGTTNLTASSTMNGAACSNCSYSWSGSATQVDNGVAFSTVNNAGPGTYSVSVTSPDGCVGNTAVSNVSILTPTAAPSCNIIYVSPTGGGTGADPSSPTDIVTAVGMGACNSVVIKMQIGDYTINNPLSIGSFMTIEGGYDATFSQKTSSKATTGGFPAQGTRIIRSTSNAEGPANALRYTAINVTGGSSYFRFQDLRIDMPDNQADSTGKSNYGLYLGAACHDYNITRCYVYSGNAGPGKKGVTGATGANGSAGSGAANGKTGAPSASAGSSGAGGNGAGATGGNGGSAVAYASGAALNGNAGNPATNPRDGGGGGSGGTGVYNTSAPAGGGKGGNGAIGGTLTVTAGPGGNGGAGLTNTTAGCGFSASCEPPNLSAGTTSALNGTNGANGTTVGTVGVGSDVSGYWVPGQGGTGSDGFGGAGGGGGGGGGGGINPSQTSGCGPSYGTSAGGAGGGGGGQGGAGGLGGTGGGSTFGIYIFNNGANGNVVDCQIVNGTAGVGGNGGNGGSGGTGGQGGVSAANATVGGCAYTCNNSILAGDGGIGGKGGNGGTGASGGAGGSGIASQVRLVGGSALVTNSSLNMLTEPVIIVDNKACTNVNIDHTTAAASPNWSSFGSGSSPSSGSGSPAATIYSTLGRKTIVMNGNNYTDFNNIITNPPSTGSITASAYTICPGSVNYISSVIGTAGLNYNWTVAPAGATITAASSGSTDINFPNTGTTSITYTVTLNLNSNCCGNLLPITTTVVVNPNPAPPTVNASGVCMGGVADFTVTAPFGGSFNWYNAASSGTLLATGTTYSVSNVTSSYTVYVESVSAAGCTSTLTPVVVTPTLVPDPTVIPGSSCDVGMVQVGINSVPGVTDYSWYSDAGGTILVQNGSSLNYSQNIPTAGGTYTVYVQANIPGCNSSSLVPVTASVSANPITSSAVFVPNDTVCINTNVNINLTPGGGNGVFTYSWSPVTSTLSSVTTTVGASTSFYVTIESDGCSKQFLYPVIVMPYPFDSIVPPMDITCSNPVLTLDGSNSVSGADITYNWTTSGGNITSSTTSNTITIDAAGVYSLTVTDNTGGCSSVETVTVVANNTPPTATISVVSSNTIISCASPTVFLSVSTTPSVGITYTWSTTETTQQIDVTNGGIISVTAIDAVSGCSVVTQYTVIGNTIPPSVSVTNTAIPCASPSVEISAGTTSTNSVTYSWSTTNGTILSGQNSSTATVGASGDYVVTVTDGLNGCTSSDTLSVSQSTVSAGFTFNPNTGFAPLDVIFTNQSSGATGYSWSFGDNGTATATDPNHTYQTSGTYTIVLIATAGPCADTAYGVIVVDESLSLAIPNVFTPNGDGTNDVFSITSTGIKEISLQIFNRWGQKLYSFTGPKAGWDGIEENGKKAPDGTYFYFVKATGFDGKEIEKQGTVNLYR